MWVQWLAVSLDPGCMGYNWSQFWSQMAQLSLHLGRCMTQFCPKVCCKRFWRKKNYFLAKKGRDAVFSPSMFFVVVVFFFPLNLDVMARAAAALLSKLWSRRGWAAGPKHVADPLQSSRYVGKINPASLRHCNGCSVTRSQMHDWWIKGCFPTLSFKCKIKSQHL